MKIFYCRLLRFFYLLPLFLLSSCVVDGFESGSSQLEFETATLENAKLLFNHQVRNENGTLDIFLEKTTKDSLIVPDWGTYNLKNLSFTDADLATVQAKLRTNNGFDFQLIFMQTEDAVIGAIEGRNLIQDKSSTQPRIEEVYFYDFTGRYYNGYRITDNIVTHQLVAKTVQHAFFGSLIFTNISFNGGDCDPNLTNSIPCYDELDAVVIRDEKPDPDHLYYDWLSHDFGGEAFLTESLTGPEYPMGGGGGSITCLGEKIPNAAGGCECPKGMVEGEGDTCIDNPCASEDRKDDTNKGFFTEKQLINGDSVDVKKATLSLRSFKDFTDSDLSAIAEGVEEIFNNAGVPMDLDMSFDDSSSDGFLNLELTEETTTLQIDSLGGFIQYIGGNTLRKDNGDAHIQAVGFVTVNNADGSLFQTFQVDRGVMISNIAHEIAHALRLNHLDQPDNGVENIEANTNNLLNSQENPNEKVRANPGTELIDVQKNKIDEFLTKINRDGKDC